MLLFFPFVALFISLTAFGLSIDDFKADFSKPLPAPARTDFERAERELRDTRDLRSTSIHEKGLRLARDYFRAHRIQEAIWTLNEIGEDQAGARLAERLRHFLSQEPNVGIEPVGHGVSRGKWVLFSNGMKAIFKKPRPELVYSNPTAEIYLYALDLLLKLDVVPTTVPRMLEGVEGSVQAFVEPWKGGQGYQSYGPCHDGNQHGYWPGHEKLWVLDYLVGNKDRKDDNFFYRASLSVVAIDGSAIFWPGCNNSWAKHPGWPAREHGLEYAPIPWNSAVLKRIADLDEAMLKASTGFLLIPQEVYDNTLEGARALIKYVTGCAVQMAVLGKR